MWLEDDAFVFPVMESLLPELKKRLNPPRDSFVDNDSSVCSVMHLVEITRYEEAVMEIQDKMIDLVRKLVERGMEVGMKLLKDAYRASMLSISDWRIRLIT
ncbi:unnamed protein product [Cochlearia groenlandica]